MRSPSLTLGVDIGHKTYASALCVAQLEHRDVAGRSEEHYAIRLLERFQPGTPYPVIADRLAEVVQKLKQLRVHGPELLVNATGHGASMVNLFEDRCACETVEVYFTYGDGRSEQREKRKQLTLGKAFLVTHLKTLLQTGCLHLPEMSEARELCQQLEDYEITLAPDANERYGAFRVGSHDDFVTALGLAVQGDGGQVSIVLGPSGPIGGYRSNRSTVEENLWRS